MSWTDDYYRQWSEDVAGEFSRRYNDADSHRDDERDVDEAVRRYAETVEDEGITHDE